MPCSHKYQRAVLFVDNSGSDVILGECCLSTTMPLISCCYQRRPQAWPSPGCLLIGRKALLTGKSPRLGRDLMALAPKIAAGMLPLARELLRAGTTVIIAANSAPSINDITAAELDALLPQVWGGS